MQAGAVRSCSNCSPDSRRRRPFRSLLVGTETGDDAAVWQIDAQQCLIATTDFFMPIVDDPRDFGRIAATNAISDVYAMGGKPILALAILGMPLGKLPIETVREILQAAPRSAPRPASPSLAAIRSTAPEPIYGLAVIGFCQPGRHSPQRGRPPRRRAVADQGYRRRGLFRRLQEARAAERAYAEMIASTTLFNRVGAELGRNPDVHAMTDVTGFGILGHGLEMARAAACGSISATSESVPGAGGAVRRAGLSHRRLGPQLGELRPRSRLPPGPRRTGGALAHRSANFRRPVDRLRFRARRFALQGQLSLRGIIGPSRRRGQCVSGLRAKAVAGVQASPAMRPWRRRVGVEPT